MGYAINILELFGIYLILMLSLNFIVGKLGIMYLGQIAFFAIGSYSTAVIFKFIGQNELISFFIGIIISVIFTLLLGELTLRLSGHYLLISSLGVCEIVRSIINNSGFTGGAEGLLVPQLFEFSNVLASQMGIFILILLFISLELIFFFLIDRSPKGRLFSAVKDNPLLLTVVGRSINRLKIEALIISSIWASVAGYLFAHYSRYIDPSSFTVMDSLILFIALLIGGIGSKSGSIIASSILIIIPSLIRFIKLPSSIISPLHQIIFAVLILVILVFKPEGLKGKSFIK
jgi:branched-chain amino acid transport system permease protein